MRRFFDLTHGHDKSAKPSYQQFPTNLLGSQSRLRDPYRAPEHAIEIKDAVKTMTMGNHDNSQCFDYFSNNLLHFRVDPSIQSPKNEQADPS